MRLPLASFLSVLSRTLAVMPRLALLPCAVAAVPGVAGAQDRIGETVMASGTVTVTRNEQRRALESPSELYRRDLIETQVQSNALLSFVGRWKLAVPQESYADLRWDAERSEVFVLRGAVRFIGDTSHPPVRVTSQRAYADPTGTVFYFEVGGGGETTLYVEDGSARFSSRAGSSVIVPAGLASTVAADGSGPTAPSPPAAAVVASANGVTATIAAEVSPSIAVPGRVFSHLRTRAEQARALARQTESAQHGPQGHGK